MKKDQELPIVITDTLDIIKALKLCDLLQKQDIIAAIVTVNTTSSD